MQDESAGGGREFPPLAVALSAATWGFAEATFFFIVPDVLLSWIALKYPRAATVACFWALAGALVGGSMMYVWGARDFEAAAGLLTRIPAIDLEMMTHVQKQIDSAGATALLAGPLMGTPYKIYAVYAGVVGVNFIDFLLVSIPSRLVRFLIVTWITVVMARYVFSFMSLRSKRVVLVACWIAFYIWYFSQMGVGSFRFLDL